MALYSLFAYKFKPNGQRRYERISSIALPRADAVRIFQNQLLAGGACLRPVKDAKGTSPDAIDPICPACKRHEHGKHVAEYLDARSTARLCGCACQMFKGGAA